ncbi:MAG: hypothetical protein QGH85_01025 [Candidatus Pacebacteria bacterium]|jgi:hypothetical protein|nr:hypothetical protein [Candidatus Paceibacterota bacterium]MDP7366301.1 hypothetical protein [Candidatus Paceibacterota bacterium]MDP7466190.1 hypothetical protein [Candidatus Paceibacterota bacterium]MDP7648490.1 hypothetical protein [Candidatus Paceibacterota bacterium]HJO89851.1 hypothetical protein [Candidatus Paceibacterota bacterium]
MKKVFIIYGIYVLIVSISILVIVIVITLLNDLATKETRKTYFVSVQKNLDYIRKYPYARHFQIESLRKNLERGGLSLTDIGTSKKELEELFIEGCKLRAQRYIRWIREKPSQYPTWIKRLRERLKEGDLSLDDIGTSEEELRSLAPKPKLDLKRMAQTPCCRKQGVFYFHSMCNCDSQNAFCAGVE